MYTTLSYDIWTLNKIISGSGKKKTRKKETHFLNQFRSFRGRGYNRHWRHSKVRRVLALFISGGTPRGRPQR